MTQQLSITKTELIQKLVRAKTTCGSCGKPLLTHEFRSYNELDKAGDLHIQFEGDKYPQWFFARCSKCTTDTALWKLIKSVTVSRALHNTI